MHRILIGLASCCFFVASATSIPAVGDEKSSPAAEKADAEKPAKDNGEKGENESDQSEPIVTHGSVEIAGQEVDYTATAGKLVMKTDSGEPKANIFFVAYERDDAEAGDRPVTFCFNGGPGSSSVWLHLGMLGPVRVKLDDHAEPLPPPHELIANPYSLLDVTDLVFIDPVSTGYSRPVKGQNKNQFHGFDEDVRSVGQFIHDYTTKYGRWGSPKFVLGESYGGLRAAGLSGHLQNRYRMYLNGVVLVSAVVDFQTLRAAGNNDVAYALFLPGYSATAWYHERLAGRLLDRPLEEVVAEAEEFALGPYIDALLAGDSLPDDQRKEVVARMAELTGLSRKYVDRSNLRVSMPRFGKELLRTRQKIVGRFDSRYTGHTRDATSSTTGYDPSGSAVFGAFTSAMNQYLRDTLKVEEEHVYEILTGNVHPWDYSEFTNRFVDASRTLRQAMIENPHLDVFAACGYYDLATPQFAMQYTRDHLNLPPELRDNFSLGFYEAGHMMYVREASLKKLRDDLVEFYDEALQAPAEE